MCNSLSAGVTMRSYDAIASLAVIDNKKLFNICRHLNQRKALPEKSSINLLECVKLGVSGYTLDRIAPLVGITHLK